MIRRILPRALAGTAVLAITVAATGACGGSSGGDTGNGNGKAASSFSMQGCEPQHMIPGNSNELCGIQVLHYLFTGLVDFDTKNKPVNMMADSITSKDQQHWTIKIKPGWKFHNGEAVTSQSYIDAWNYAAYAPNAFGNSYFFANIVGYDKLNPAKGKPKVKTMAGLKKVDDTTFKVTLTAPFSQFPLTLGYTGFGPLPKVAFKDIKAFEQKPIGNGPYEMNGSWDHNKGIKLKRYAGYTGPNKGHVDNVDYKIYSAAQTAYNDLTAGNLDQAQIPPSRVAEAKAQLGDRYIEAPTSQFSRFDFPMYDKRFQNVDMRRAFSLAIDRQAVATKIFNGTVTPAKSWISPVVAGARDDACQGYCDYDPAKAKALLKKAGGFKGTLTVWYNPDNDNGVWVQAIANQWKKNLGINNIKLKSQPFAQYLTSQSDHKMTGPFRNSWLMDYPSMQNYLEPLWTTGASANRTGYSNKLVDKYVKKGNAAKTVEAGFPDYYKAEDQVAKDMPGIPLWFNKTTQGYDEKITDVTIDPFGLVRISDIQLAK